MSANPEPDRGPVHLGFGTCSNLKRFPCTGGGFFGQQTFHTLYKVWFLSIQDIIMISGCVRTYQQRIQETVVLMVNQSPSLQVN
jgi:hypothetical protein